MSRYAKQMRHRRIVILAAAALIQSCSEAKPLGHFEGQRLVLWLHPVDDNVPDQFNPGIAGGSVDGLATALRTCGGHDPIIVDLSVLGAEVSVGSSSKDEAIINCVRRHVEFGFNASRTTSDALRRGDRGTRLGLGDDS